MDLDEEAINGFTEHGIVARAGREKEVSVSLRLERGFNENGLHENEGGREAKKQTLEILRLGGVCRGFTTVRWCLAA